MKSNKNTRRRVRPQLLILLWIWVIAVAVVVDMFWNVSALDGIRPRSNLYRGMRVATRKMVGVQVEKDYHPVRQWHGRLLQEVKTPEDVRAMVTFCRYARRSDVPALKRVALTAKDPIAAGNAMRALGRLRAVAEDPRLVALVSDERRRVRQETVLALGKNCRRSSIPVLESLVADEDATMRLLAIRAIGEIGGGRATTVLREVLARDNFTEAERAFASAALR